MTTFAPNYTPRVKCKYRAAGVIHTIQVRAPRGADAGVTGTTSNKLFDVFNAFASSLADDHEWISNEYALTDSDVFIPLATPPAVTGTVPVADFTPIQKITAQALSGRTGRGRARLYMYGILWAFTDVADDPNTVPYDGIVSGSEDARVLTVQTVANAFFASGEGLVAHWYSQMTIKPNDHLLHLVRRGVIS